MNNPNEILFTVADEFTKLSTDQQLKIGLKLGLLNLGAVMYSPGHLEEMVFVKAYKSKRLIELVTEIQRVKDATDKPS